MRYHEERAPVAIRCTNLPKGFVQLPLFFFSLGPKRRVFHGDSAGGDCQRELSADVVV